MKRKLIYISFIRLTETILNDYYIDFSINKGAEVEYWDIVPLLRYDYHELGTLDVHYLKYIKTFKEFEELLDRVENQHAIYVMLVTYQNKYIRPFKILSNRGLRMVYIFTGIMPSYKKVSRLNRIIDLLTRSPLIFLKSLIDLISMKLYQKFNIVKPFEIEFVVGENLSHESFHAKKVTPINFFDYDYFKQVEFLNNFKVDGKYILFIDHNAPAHSDTLVHVNEEKYFKSINRFLGLIEEAQKIKIVIAANPKSKYGSEKYEGREFYRLRTPELAKSAEYIIIPYNSSAISYAVLNVKPMVLIFNKECSNTWPTLIDEMESIASFFDIDLVDADKILHGNELVIQPPNIEKYKSYKYNYLTSKQSEDKSSDQIYWDEIIKL